MANSVDPDKMACYDPSHLVHTVCPCICFGLPGSGGTLMLNRCLSFICSYFIDVTLVDSDFKTILVLPAESVSEFPEEFQVFGLYFSPNVYAKDTDLPFKNWWFYSYVYYWTHHSLHPSFPLLYTPPPSPTNAHFEFICQNCCYFHFFRMLTLALFDHFECININSFDPFYAPLQKVVRYYVILSEILSVPPSVCLSVSTS